MGSKRILWAGRFVHAKGRLGVKLATEIFPKFENVVFELYGGPIPQDIANQSKNIVFKGLVHDLQQHMRDADLVLGGGRVALEAMQQGIPVMAVGQKCYVGILNEKNISFAKKTNFGDMFHTENIDYRALTNDLAAFISNRIVPSVSFYEEVLENYALPKVASRIRDLYDQAMASKKVPRFVG